MDAKFEQLTDFGNHKMTLERKSVDLSDETKIRAHTVDKRIFF